MHATLWVRQEGGQRSMKTRGSGLRSDHKHLLRAARGAGSILCIRWELTGFLTHLIYHSCFYSQRHVMIIVPWCFFPPSRLLWDYYLSTFNLSPWLHSSFWMKHSFLSKSFLCFFIYFSDFIPSFLILKIFNFPKTLMADYFIFIHILF